jgi:hypothetical protein
MKKIFYCLLITATLFFSLPALAQTFADNAAVVQLKYLLQLNGNWQAAATILLKDGKKQAFTYYADFKKTAGNNGLTMNEWADIPGIGKLIGANLIGIDPADEKVHWYSVDNMGTTHEHIGEFTDGQHFSMVYKGNREGKEYIETITLILNGTDNMDFNLSATLGGKEEEAITGTFQRKDKKKL